MKHQDPSDPWAMPDDPLAGARGIFNCLLLVIPLWLVIGAAFLFAIHSR